MSQILLFPSAQQLNDELHRAQQLKSIPLSPVSVSDVELLSVGAYTPLRGFLTRADYERVVGDMHLADGDVWSIPITLPVTRPQADAIREGEEIALVEPGGRILATMLVHEKFNYDKKREAREVFRTEDEEHPGVARLYQQGEVYLGGPITPLQLPSDREFLMFRHTPTETRRMFERRGWKTIVGFQTRNPIHRSHEYIQKTALEIVDGLLLHPLVGATKSDDVPADVRMRTYEAILDKYYPRNRVVLSVFPAAMRYAGPREAVWHAIARKNYGCTHFIVGRDHAGVGNYYGSYDAQILIDSLPPHELGIVPLKFEHSFYCATCGNLATPRTCPHGKEHHVTLSGTKVREMLTNGEMPPPEFTRPEIAAILTEAYQTAAAAR
ncbi:MAG: sulfate adenylyltransferase [Vicinamibacterales bacterium]